MNNLLAKHGPKDPEAKEKWKERWENMHSDFQPLADALKELHDRELSIRPDAFDCPNHYAKLTAELARKQLLKDIMEMLPTGCFK